MAGSATKWDEFQKGGDQDAHGYIQPFAGCEGQVLTKSPDKCLALYSEEEWLKQIEATNALPKLTNEAARRFRRIYFGNSTSAELDKQGRILIPANLREYAGLTKDVTLVGVTDHVEVWDEKAWNAYNDENDLTEILSDLENVDL